MQLNLIFCGVGGQGIILASDIYCEAALIEGFDVAKAETHGMAQRGGSIITHVRIGEEVSSPIIEKGKGDILLGFEILETARALPLLKKEGIVIMNMKFIPPSSMLQESTQMMTVEELRKVIRKEVTILYEIEATKIAHSLGNDLVMNTILLGALSALPQNPVGRKSLEEAISKRIKKNYLILNLEAFNKGREVITTNIRFIS